MVTTIYDVAQRAGVSAPTVSRALSPDKSLSRSVQNREKIFAAVKALGYTPNVSAQSLRQMRTNVIAVAGWFKMKSFTSAETLWGIHERLAGTKYALYLMESHENYKLDENTFRKFAHTNFICGIILLTRTVSKTTINLLKKLKIPVLLTENAISGVDSFTVDNFKGGYLAVKHLLDQGCKNIALIAGWLDNPNLRGRVLGCEKALKEAGLSLRSQFLINPYDHYGAGERAAKKFMGLHPAPDGVFSAAGDVVAMGAINTFQEKGIRVPEDVRVVGFDDIRESAYFHPALTTVHQPVFELGFKAADHIIQALEGKSSAPQSTILEPHLVVRKSG